MSSVPATRVTTIAAAVESSSEGIWATEAVADGQQGVVCSAVEKSSRVTDADPQSADDVDEKDQDARDRVAADELRGAVHGPVEVGLACDVLAAPPRLVLVDQSGVQIGVDRHLLAGHASRVNLALTSDTRPAPW